MEPESKRRKLTENGRFEIKRESSTEDEEQDQDPLQPGKDGNDFGCVSSDSSFYGDDDEQARLEEEAETDFLPLFVPDLSKDGADNDSLATIDLPPWYLSVHAIRGATVLASLGTTRPKTTTPPQNKAPEYNPYEGMRRCARQLDETVREFLDRLPPSSTSLRDAGGPWIHVANPTSSRRETDANVAAFKTDGMKYLSTLPHDDKGNPIKLTPKAADAVTAKIVALSRCHGLTTGKWMIFPLPPDVDHVWETVARATVAGSLGCAAKVAVDDEGKADRRAGRLVAIYTDDCENLDDVKRVVRGLADLKIVTKKGVGIDTCGGGVLGIFYKSDALTYLGIDNGNKYGLKASMYSSKELLGSSK